MHISVIRAPFKFRTVNGKLVNETEYEAMMGKLGHKEVNWMEKIQIILHNKPSRNMPVRDLQPESMGSDKQWRSAVRALADPVQAISKRASDTIIARNSSSEECVTTFRPWLLGCTV
jgi:hypothetical protein